MNTRQIIVVDCETNGLDFDKHEAFEVAWWNLTTDTRGRFVPNHNINDLLHRADIRALQVNRYIDRIPGEQYAPWLPLLDELMGNLRDENMAGQTFAGSNPSFDAAMLNKLIRRAAREDRDTVYGFEPDPWHHRLLDLSAYAAGVLGLHLGELPGLATVCDLLNVKPGDHTAAGDVEATGQCFRRLMAKAVSA